jgi:DNA-binding response OmpR family regulator
VCDHGVVGPTIVLIVENDEMIADLIALIVKNAGYAPLVAHDGRRALELVREQRPALLIADPILPDLAGTGLLAAVQSERALGLRTILATASPRTDAALVDVDAVLSMPFHVATLEALLRRLLPPRPHMPC